ncbi:MAG: hypothetical protein RIG82_03630 [Phycisphaeraceae bacterium]
MRILWVTPTWGGYPWWRLGDLRSVAMALEARGHEVCVVAGWAAGDSPMGDRVVVMERKRRGPESVALVRFTRWARGVMARERFDVSLSVTTLVSADVMVPTRSLWRVGLKRERGVRPGRGLRRALFPGIHALLSVERAALRAQASKRVVAMDDDLWAQVASSAYGPAVPSASLAAPLELELVDGDEAGRRVGRLRESLGIGADQKVVVFASLRPDEDGLATVLAAHERLVRAGLPVVLVLATWVGYGLNERVARLGVRDSVRLVGTPGRLADLVRAADAVVHPAFDGAGELMVPLGLCLRRPMVVSDRVGGLDRVPGSGVGTRVVAWGSGAGVWAEAVRGVLEAGGVGAGDDAALVEAHGVGVAASGLEAQLQAAMGVRGR